MNSIQKAAIFAAATLLVILVILHSPWSGYETGVKILTDENGIMMVMGDRYWPVSEWHSSDSVITWFGGLINFIVVALSLVGLTGFLCYLYRTPKIGDGP